MGLYEPDHVLMRRVFVRSPIVFSWYGLLVLLTGSHTDGGVGHAGATASSSGAVRVRRLALGHLDALRGAGRRRTGLVDWFWSGWWSC